MAQFLLLLHDDPATWEKLNPEELQQAFGKYMTWGKRGRESGVCLGGQKLRNEPGKVIRGEKAIVTDGPYSETKEMLGGYYLIEAANYREAVQRSLDHPHLQYGGTIEVREIEQMPPA